MRYGIVLIPEDRVKNYSFQVSEQLAKHGSIFMLEDGRIYPHVSLCHFDANQLTTGVAHDILSGLTAGISLLASNFYSYIDGPGEGFIDVEYIKTPGLIALQDGSFEATKKVRDPHSEPYRAVGERYRPHLTLGRLKHFKENVFRTLTDYEKFSGHFPTIGLFELGENGTCIKLIATK